MKYLKWNFPILRALKNSVEKRGYVKTILWFAVIVVGSKIILINGSIALVNTIFGIEIPYGPIGQTIGGYFEHLF
jgi:hypothetical protein|tara:strand:+ start:1662 stop:1886 length:225 start_codon:yes stop_codon:yes gene_type:complete